MSSSEQEKVLLPHHEQQKLCTTRLPYRQGRKLTAVKVYTINNESNHLLLFGVPRLNLRQETKSLFTKFGKVTSFVLTPEHTVEPFTETYHIVYESIQSARIAKKMLDTKNFYGGSLHISYAPEFETINETRNKILKRRNDVIARLKNLQRDVESVTIAVAETEVNSANTIGPVLDVNTNKRKLNMGEINTISIGKQIRDVVFKKKKKKERVDKIKCNDLIVKSEINPNNSKDIEVSSSISENNSLQGQNKESSTDVNKSNNDVEIIDFTSTEHETITNINDSLNYNKFGNEIVRQVEQKPLNKIVFNFNNKKI